MHLKNNNPLIVLAVPESLSIKIWNLFTQTCSFSADCVTKGLHAHHPRDCLYHLRDWSVTRLHLLLQVRTTRAELQPVWGKYHWWSGLCFCCLSITECLSPGWNQLIVAHFAPVRQVSSMCVHQLEWSISQFDWLVWSFLGVCLVLELRDNSRGEEEPCRRPALHEYRGYCQ